ncbi:DUF1983 domain-containing protein [Vibrio sp. 2175-1]|uniref:phage tail tip fiber protein n=1 Tax=Vibrio TaxID=662 RepID=UPI001CDCF8F5|nr:MULTISPECIES: DUF1983 domain-containing protein [Vibrio]MCA2497773.1 DUF1983 domain-containing protein [Vibrio alginolyticus]MDW2217460.1 DUF1983 domain-containing protein [Vibrio sp. 2175-1]
MAKNKTPFRAGRTLDALYENVEILTGQRGGDYKAVTAKEVSALKGTVSTIIRGGSGGDSGGEEVIERPHAPINVQGFGGFSSVLLSWDNPTFQGFAHAEVWRSTTNNLAQATLIGTTPATVYSDIVSLGTGWYYWVRFINKSDLAGPHHSAAGLYVETNQDIGDVIDELADQLESSQLFQALQSEIYNNEQANSLVQSNLDSAKALLESADQALQSNLDAAKADLEQADTDLSTSLTNAKTELEGSIARVETEYKAADVTMSASITDLETVVTDGQSSLAQQASQIRADFESADSSLSADIINVKTVLTDADAALASRVDSVEANATVGNSQLSSALSELERASARMNEVIAMTVRQLNASYKTVSSSETAVTNAKITETQEVIANAEQALAQQITELEASFQTAETAINATITTLTQTVATEDQALSQRITDIDAAYKAADATTSSSISTLEQTVADNDSAMAQRVDTIESNYKAADSTLSSSVTSLSSTVTNNKNAITTRVNSVEAAYKSADSSLSSQISSLSSTVASEDQALSDRIDTTTATINGVSATVTSHSQSIASIDSNGSSAYRAMWTQKASAGQVTAGIGLLAGSGGVSQVVVSASQFFVFNPNSPTTKTPLFAIDSGKVIIPEALIEKATIQILNAQTITADYVKSGISITSPVINGGTVTGSVLKVGASGPYSGYHFYVNSSGTAYLNNAVVKGHVDASSGTFSNVTIDDTCTVENVVLKGQTITPKVISTPANKSLTATYGTIATASVTLPFRDSRSRAFASWNFTLSAVSLSASANLYVRILVNGAVVKTITHKALFISSATYACGDAGTCIANYYALPAQITGAYGFTPTANTNTVQIQVMQSGGITVNAENITLTLEGGQSA